MISRSDLIAFEAEIAELFNAGKIRAPVHLDGGNEDQLIDVFRSVRREDWVVGSWRMHYKCLLKGVPPATLRNAIMSGQSISLCFPSHRILSSAIVGDAPRMATGIALSIKRRHSDERVHCFVGDMTARTGAFRESVEYAACQGLPVRFIVEDNGRSVCTETASAWGSCGRGFLGVERYHYESPWPHAGAGVRVQF